MRPAVLVIAAALLTGCGASTQPHATPSASAPAAPSGNVLACQHYSKQRDWYRSLATPGPLDAARALGWVREDAALAHDPQLRRALTADAAAIAAAIHGGNPAGNPAAAIKTRCQHFGVTIGGQNASQR